MKITLAFLITGLFFSSACSAEEIAPKVDEELGKKLVRSIFTHMPKPGVEEVKEFQKNFIDYIAIGIHQGEQNDYAVNPWTGDVWDLWSCERVSNASLRKMQTEIKQKFNSDEIKEYKRLHNLRPLNVGLRSLLNALCVDGQKWDTTPQTIRRDCRKLRKMISCKGLISLLLFLVEYRYLSIA